MGLSRKYIVLIGDGMADYPVAELGGKTPLQTARTPNLDRLARQGTLGRVNTIPPGFSPGSDVANLTVFGYDPAVYYTGRAPLEAVAMGVKLAPADVAFRCNLVTLLKEDGDTYMEDFSAGHISTEEAGRIVKDLAKELGNEEFNFYPGVSYRHLLVWRNGETSLRLKTTPPHDITGGNISPHVPEGDGDEEILWLMNRAQKILPSHPVNLERTRMGKKPGNAIWLWGQGKAPVLKPITHRFGIRGSVISAVDLIKGIGYYAGLEIVNVPGATGYLDTNYAGKAEYALKALQDQDLVYVHVEAPDEAAHNGNLKDKIQAIEDFDRKIVAPILEGAEKLGGYRLLILPDHFTPLTIKTHSPEPVPFIVFSSEEKKNPIKAGRSFDEESAEKAGLLIEKGHELMEKFIKGFSAGQQLRVS
jgi:2,3-bisphosphoglycerate-independent phosphoglycerate mutase